MSQLAENENIYFHLVNSLILKSRLSLVVNQFDRADEFLKEAENLVKEKNMGSLGIKFQEERRKITKKN